jgi:hypothetical protein
MQRAVANGSLPFDTLAKLANCDLEKIGIESLTDIRRIKRDPDTGEIVSLTVQRLLGALLCKRRQLEAQWKSNAGYEDRQAERFLVDYQAYLDAGGKPDATLAVPLPLTKSELQARIDVLEKEKEDLGKQKQDLEKDLQAKEQEIRNLETSSQAKEQG